MAIPTKGTALLNFLTVNIDTMMTANQCENLIIFGDLNQNVVCDAFNTLLVVYDLHNYVSFPTHSSAGSSLDPVVTDLPPHTAQCFPLDFMGTSDHVAVLTKIQLKRPHEHYVEPHCGLGQQVKLAPHKPQLLNVSMSSVALRLIWDGKTLVPQNKVEVLGVTYDYRMTFRTHIERLALEASGKLASLKRMSWLLGSIGMEILYKAHVRSCMEYACLRWGGAANKHLALLDKVQGRAVRLIRNSGAGQEPRLHSLQYH
ncbi:hypothetical protein GWK47_020337 [Chionoecetes opilio]|uniref:Uncharacterized protein n=1 Tax=Chionoecetes opilio TaxID=41210 RepID=A0A8J5CF88_CHIOP|nr:hypothetical protein GWK47_020337 [Chionoecetes opilio]